MEKLKKIWQNKWKILEGVWNSWFPTRYVNMVSSRRTNICVSNVCGYYDHEGTGDKVILKGFPSCGGCGCKLSIKSASLSSWCYLKDIGQKPLWDAEMSEEEEKQFEAKTGITNNHG